MQRPATRPASDELNSSIPTECSLPSLVQARRGILWPQIDGPRLARYSTWRQQPASSLSLALPHASSSFSPAFSLAHTFLLSLSFFHSLTLSFSLSLTLSSFFKEGRLKTLAYSRIYARCCWLFSSFSILPEIKECLS